MKKTKMTKLKFCKICRQSKPVGNFPTIRYTCTDCIELSRQISVKKSLLKIKVDPYRRLRRRISNAIHRSLKGHKKFSISDCLNCTIDELRTHLEKQFEPWMSWSNWGNYDPKTWDDNDRSTWRWQIDHVIPQTCLPYLSIDDDNFKKCWSLDNLRPLSAKQNVLDGVNKIRHLDIYDME